LHNIKIFTDSTSDLSKELIEKNYISVVPLYITFKDEIYRDSIDINTEGLYKKVEELNILPKTSAPSPQDFIDAFRPYVEEGKDILYIGLSSKLSATIQNANIAKQEFPNANIEIVDSLNLSTGIGILVMKACDFREQGMNIKEISEKVKELVPRVRTFFIIDTLEYLHKGGRCSSLQNLIGTAFKIKPVIRVIDGGMAVGQKVRGKRDKMIDFMLKETLKNADNMDTKRIFIGHSLWEKPTHYLKEQLIKSTSIENIHIIQAGCVISSHCGPNTIGIYYIKK
jgi:DegV family protein with EDD domain